MTGTDYKGFIDAIIETYPELKDGCEILKKRLEQLESIESEFKTLSQQHQALINALDGIFQQWAILMKKLKLSEN